MNRPSVSSGAVPSPASVRLAQNRARLADWLEQDSVRQANPSLGGWAARVALPLISGLRHHPTASLALGALAKAWLRPSPAGSAQPLESQALGAALGTVRRHPKTTLAVAALAGGAAWWWSRSRPQAPPPH